MDFSVHAGIVFYNTFFQRGGPLKNLSKLNLSIGPPFDFTINLYVAQLTILSAICPYSLP